MPSTTRRVVTGHDSSGKSCVIIDEVIPNDNINVLVPKQNPKRRLTNIWIADRVPASNSGDGDTVASPLRLTPPTGGAVFRTLEIPPDTETDFSAMRDYFTAMDALDTLDADSDRHPGMHRTNTIDLIAVISGEIHLVLDNEEVVLRHGDCAVQRGTIHAWSNRSDRPCIMAIVLMDAVPLDR